VLADFVLVFLELVILPVFFAGLDVVVLALDLVVVAGVCAKPANPIAMAIANNEIFFMVILF
jgi:hypothetical protein